MVSHKKRAMRVLAEYWYNTLFLSFTVTYYIYTHTENQNMYQIRIPNKRWFYVVVVNISAIDVITLEPMLSLSFTPYVRFMLLETYTNRASNIHGIGLKQCTSVFNRIRNRRYYFFPLLTNEVTFFFVLVITDPNRIHTHTQIQKIDVLIARQHQLKWILFHLLLFFLFLYINVTSVQCERLPNFQICIFAIALNGNGIIDKTNKQTT